MANGKKSFLLYVDIIHSVNILNNEEAGQLFKHILDYVNDKNPMLEDRLLQATFEPIRQSLKRDLEKYDKRVDVARHNGEKGGRPRKAEITQKSQSVKNKPKKAVSVSVSVSDSVSVNDSVSDSVINLPFDSKRFSNAWSLWKEYKKKDFRFTFKSAISESSALSKLHKMSEGHEENALLIIEQSVANGWKGFFQLSKSQNKKSNEPSQDYMLNLKSRLNGE
tara:strand:- start:238 stop:903 length:666 start_codon:yes stop_codon:yes gene_type:complete